MKKYLFICLIFLLPACSESTVEPDLSRVGFTYFPLVVGQYSDFQIEEVEYDITGEITPSAFQLRTQVVDSFSNQSGGITYIVHRFRRDNQEELWDFQSAWSVYVTSNQAVIVEENVPFVKLSFPLEDDKVWDGNKMNTLEQDDYQLDSVGFSYITPHQDTLAKTVTVIQQDNQDFIIQQDKRVEIYADNIGLVFKEDILINYCADETCIGQQIIESGRTYKQTILSYGSL